MFSEYASRFLAQSQLRSSVLRDAQRHFTGTALPVPLFQSTAEFQSEDHEHEQEISDYYALKSSRRHFGVYADSESESEQGQNSQNVQSTKDIKSSWNPSQSHISGQYGGQHALGDSHEEETGGQSMTSSSTINPRQKSGSSVFQQSAFMDSALNSESRAAPLRNFRHHHDIERSSPGAEQPLGDPRAYSEPADLGNNVIPNHVQYLTESDNPDAFWAKLYGFAMAFMFTTSFLIWIRTDSHRSDLLGDGIYAVLQKASSMLIVDTLIAVLISFAWILSFRYMARSITHVLLFGTPFAMAILGLYPFIMSFKGKWGGHSFQDKAMRTISFIPALIAVVWIYMLYRNRRSLTKAVQIIQLSCQILASNGYLIVLSYGTLFSVTIFSWIWIGMFSRVFLSGGASIVSGKLVFITDFRSWVIGGFFVFMYLWTLGIASGFQRASTSAIVSQWYFYRHAIPALDPRTVVLAACNRASTNLLGTISLSSFLVLLVRLPLLVMPSRIGKAILVLGLYNLTLPLSVLGQPLALTYASIHSISLKESSNQLRKLHLVRNDGDMFPDIHTRPAYPLAKMLLSAIRIIACLSFGVGAWVNTTRDPKGSSLYGYMVGIVAGTISWGILGATEVTLKAIVDSALVCVVSDDTDGSHCREAYEAFR